MNPIEQKIFEIIRRGACTWCSRLSADNGCEYDDYGEICPEAYSRQAEAIYIEVVEPLESRANRIAQDFLCCTEWHAGQAKRDKRCADPSPEEESLGLVEIAL